MGRAAVSTLRWSALVVAFLACLAPLAHVLELPNKLRLDGPLWLGIQQHLYNVWGPAIGGPTEIAGLILSLVLVVADRKRARLYGLAAFSYAAMIVSFFLFNRPVNEALSSWTPATLPLDWASYRLRWEIGHAIAALFGLVALVAIGASIVSGDRQSRA